MIQKLEHILFKTSRAQFISFILFLIFLKTGIQYMPNLESSRHIAQNPFIAPLETGEHYLFYNWLSPFIGWCLRAQSRFLFLLLHFCLSCAFSSLFFYTSFKKFSPLQARSSILLFTLLPASATSYYWVGMDSMLLFLMALALSIRNQPWMLGILGVCLGLQHFEQSFFASLAVLVALHFASQQKYAFHWTSADALALFIGVILGKVFLTLIFFSLSIELKFTRFHWVFYGYRGLFEQFFYHFQTILWSVLALGWCLVFKYSTLPDQPRSFLLTLAGLCCLLPIVEDQTRVLCIISFPLMVIFILWNESFLKQFSQKTVTYLFALWILMPWTWVWQGIVRDSALPRTLSNLLLPIWSYLNH